MGIRHHRYREIYIRGGLQNKFSSVQFLVEFSSISFFFLKKYNFCAIKSFWFQLKPLRLLKKKKFLKKKKKKVESFFYSENEYNKQCTSLGTGSLQFIVFFGNYTMCWGHGYVLS